MTRHRPWVLLAAGAFGATSACGNVLRGADSYPDGSVSDLDAGVGDALDATRLLDAASEHVANQPCDCPRLFAAVVWETNPNIGTNPATCSTGVLAWDHPEAIASPRPPDVVIGSDSGICGKPCDAVVVKDQLFTIDMTVALDTTIGRYAAIGFPQGRETSGRPEHGALRYHPAADWLTVASTADMKLFLNASALDVDAGPFATWSDWTGARLAGLANDATGRVILVVNDPKGQAHVLVAPVLAGPLTPTFELAGVVGGSADVTTDATRLYVIAAGPPTALYVWEQSSIAPQAKPDVVVSLNALPTYNGQIDLANDVLVATGPKTLVFPTAHLITALSKPIVIDVPSRRARLGRKSGSLFIDGGTGSIGIWDTVTSTPVLRTLLPMPGGQLTYRIDLDVYEP